MIKDKKFILVVDDDPDDRELIISALKECKGPVDISELQDGSQVMNFLKACPENRLPQMILLDLNMPKINGFDVLKEIKAQIKFQAIPVYVFTTSNSWKERLHGLRLGATGVVTKPSYYLDWIQAISKLTF